MEMCPFTVNDNNDEDEDSDQIRFIEKYYLVNEGTRLDTNFSS